MMHFIQQPLKTSSTHIHNITTFDFSYVAILSGCLLCVICSCGINCN
jgi:hypothetical protein